MGYIIGGAIVALAGILVLVYWLVMSRMAKNLKPTFWEFAVKGIEKRYKGDLPQSKILFYGSSSISFWKTLKDDMAPLQVLNHGIPGIKITDATYYIDRLATPFHPKAMVLFAGTNDMSGIKGGTRTGEEVYRSTIEFFEKARESMPGTPIYYIAITPTPTKRKVRADVDTANRMIREYIEENANMGLRFIDCEKGILDENGQPKRELFRMDGIHFNGKGYKVWTECIRPVLMNS